jgi:hypothetical protein
MPLEWVTGRASNFEFQLKEVWKKLETPLLRARTDDEVTAVFREFAEPYPGEFVPRLSSDILSLLNSPDFPKRASPRIKFLARSLAGRPALSFRTSRDICEKADAHEKLKSPHRIIRREFYVECSCGYRGPALDNACRKCGAEPPLSLYEWSGRAPVEEESKTPHRTQRELNQEVPMSRPSNPNSLQCECGAIVAAQDPAKALEALAEHKRFVHGKTTNNQEQKPG